MTENKPAIGFVGLGHMGGSMAVRYLAAGYPVYGTSLSRQDAAELEAKGLHWRATPREVAEGSDILASSVPDEARPRSPLRPSPSRHLRMPATLTAKVRPKASMMPASTEIMAGPPRHAALISRPMAVASSKVRAGAAGRDG